MNENGYITVILSDSSSRYYPIDPKENLKNFQKRVADDLCLKWDNYFGFYVLDEWSNKCWLTDKKLISQDVKPVEGGIKLYFALKFFDDFDILLSDDMTKKLFYNHLRLEILSGDIECDSDRCFQLLAITLLLEEESFRGSRQDIQRRNMIPAYLFLRHPSIEYCTNEIFKACELMRSNDKTDLMDIFMDTIKNLPYKLNHYFHGKDFNSQSIVIGISRDGFCELSRTSRTVVRFRYNWLDIAKVSNNKLRISLELQNINTHSSLRHRNFASGVNYEFISVQLAKSIVYLIKETMSFSSTNYERVKNNTASKQKKFNPSSIKKINSNTLTYRSERRRTSLSMFTTNSENEQLSRSSSKVSLSSTQNGSCITNDSGSLHLDDCGTLHGGLSYLEAQQKFDELYPERLRLLELIKNRTEKAIELCKEECMITGFMPSDFNQLSPKCPLKLTQKPIQMKFVHTENANGYEEDKKNMLLEMELLNSIIETLRKQRSNPKIRKDIEAKRNRIKEIVKELKNLESENALSAYRSNSVGCLNSVTVNFDKQLSLEDSKKIISKNISTAPLARRNNLTAEQSRSQSDLKQAINDMYPRVTNESGHYMNYLATSNHKTQNENYGCYTSTNKSSFNRFMVSRRPVNCQIQTPIQHTDDLASAKSDSSTSTIDDYSEESFSRTNSLENYNSENAFNVIPRSTNTMERNYSVRPSNYRDSKEISVTRLKARNDRQNNIKLRRYNPKSNVQNRKSVSLEDLQDIDSLQDLQVYCTVQKPNFHSSFSNRITYKPSKRSERTSNMLTRGRQPSINFKQAKAKSTHNCV